MKTFMCNNALFLALICIVGNITHGAEIADTEIERRKCLCQSKIDVLLSF